MASQINNWGCSKCVHTYVQAVGAKVRHIRFVVTCDHSNAPINMMPQGTPLGQGWGNIGDLHGEIVICPYTRALISLQIPWVVTDDLILYYLNEHVSNILVPSNFKFISHTKSPTLRVGSVSKYPSIAPHIPLMCPRGVPWGIILIGA